MGKRFVIPPPEHGHPSGKMEEEHLYLLPAQIGIFSDPGNVSRFDELLPLIGSELAYIGNAQNGFQGRGISFSIDNLVHGRPVNFAISDQVIDFDFFLADQTREEFGEGTHVISFL